MNFFTQSDSLLKRLTGLKQIKLITFVIALLEASISPVLPEAFLLVVLAYRKELSWKLFSLISAFGSSCGALIMYVMGRFIYTTYGDKILQFLHGQEVAKQAQILFTKNAFATQFFAALTPLPDRVFSFLAGAFSISVLTVFVATFLGRLIRVVPVAYCSHRYGEEARNYLKKNTKRTTYILVVLFVLYCLYGYFA